MLVTLIGKNLIRMIPPLIATEADCDKAVEILRASIKGVKA
jgi:acetylornithine/N-succinyldiaminopimelate aminotransferase